jgi:hypothetical protein
LGYEIGECGQFQVVGPVPGSGLELGYEIAANIRDRMGFVGEKDPLWP